MTSAQWMTRYQESVMNTFGPPQRILVRGEGPHVWDADGKQYLDLLGGIAVNSLGHCHPKLVEAVVGQMNQLTHISNFFASEPQIKLAEKLLALLGQPGAVFFTNSGAEANEAAFKATRRTGRTRVIAAEGSFHGRTMGALALTSKEAYRAPFEPLPGDVTWVPYGDIEALEAAIDDTVAAVLLESIQGEAGVVVPPDGYLKAARDATTRHGALLWLDEVQTGIGRTGAWFDHASAGILPDLITVAKGLGGGIPIGACIALGEAATLLQPGNHGTTFGGNPVATAAALAVIDTIESEGLLANALTVGDVFRDGLADHPQVAEVTGRGMLIGIVLTSPVSQAVQQAALEAGLIINNPTPDRLRLAPPLNLTTDLAREAVATLRGVIDQVSS